MNMVSDQILKRIYLLFACFLLFSTLIVWRIIHLQFVQGERWKQVQANERVYYKKVPADRGAILASDGTIMAVTLPFYRVAIDATVLNRGRYAALEDSLDLLCRKLAKHFGGGEFDARYFKNKFKKAMQERDRHVYLFPYKRILNYPEMRLLRTFPVLNRGRYKGGLIVEKIQNKRFYPFRDMARITLGLVIDDSIPAKGIEHAFNAMLRGKDGLMLVQRIPGGVEVPLSEYGEVETRDGYDVHTTIDVHMQDVVSTALRQGMERTGSRAGVAILMEVSTGEIKAVANYPENLNNALATLWEPGSTFKLASVMAAIEDGYATPETRIETGNGTVTYYDRVIRDAHGSGNITLQQAFERSSNVAISKLIWQHYRSRPGAFIQRLEDMGILSPVGCQITGEPAPYVIRPSDRHWSGPTLPLLSTGYSIMQTPLQTLTFFNAVANNGRMMRPLLVRQVTNNSQVVASYRPTVLREQICSETTLRRVRGMLEGVVENGTARNIKGTYYRIAGKTGTAKKLENGVYQKKYRASFCGYFPAENPRYSCIVVVDEPTNGEFYGADVAAPIFKQIADNIHATDMRSQREERFASRINGRRIAYPVTRTVALDDARQVYDALSISTPGQPESDFVRARQSGATVSLSSMRTPREFVPDVTGMTAKDALALLENLGLNVRLRGHGKVRDQSLPAGTRIRDNLAIDLTLDSQP